MHEYCTREFVVDYGIRSIGWETSGGPAQIAEKWINERAAEGFKVFTIATSGPSHLVVVMERTPIR